MNAGLLSAFKVDDGEEHHVAARHPAEALRVYQDTIGHDVKHGLMSVCVHPCDPDEELKVIHETKGDAPEPALEGFTVERHHGDWVTTATLGKWVEFVAHGQDGPGLICSSVLP